MLENYEVLSLPEQFSPQIIMWAKQGRCQGPATAPCGVSAPKVSERGRYRAMTVTPVGQRERVGRGSSECRTHSIYFCIV